VDEQRVILDAALHRSVIRGTLTATSGERREFHGWLELHTALEAMLGGGAVGSSVCDRLGGEHRGDRLSGESG